MRTLGLSPLRAVFAGAILALSASAASAADGLSGSWSGSGTVVLSSGQTEKARCKASFRKQGGRSYSMHAVCASSSARAQQDATLEQVGVNHYEGEFTNAEYNVTGSIHLTVNGNNLSAKLHGGGASAFFSLSR